MTKNSRGPSSLESLPLVLTIEEAATVLRIGRSAAYEQARLYLSTEGRQGLPVLRLGRRLRVPRSALIEFLTTRTATDGDRT